MWKGTAYAVDMKTAEVGAKKAFPFITSRHTCPEDRVYVAQLDMAGMRFLEVIESEAPDAGAALAAAKAAAKAAAGAALAAAEPK
jgi:hypothetical protein